MEYRNQNAQKDLQCSDANKRKHEYFHPLEVAYVAVVGHNFKGVKMYNIEFSALRGFSNLSATSSDRHSIQNEHHTL